MHRQGAHKVATGEAAVWSVLWVAVSIAFVGLLWWYLGGTSGDEAARNTANLKAAEFITGYLVEKALAVDNIFAIPGLCAMYFLLAGLHERFHLLPYGLAMVLIPIGGKMLLIDVYKIPVTWSLMATAPR